VLWAYDGWIETTYVGSEIRDPGRVLPRSIILSTVLVIVLYTLATLAYVWVLSPDAMAKVMAGSQLVASDAARVTLGSAGAAFVAIAIIISTLGANNGIILTAARIPYAMARGGHFFAWAGRVHPRWATPVTALVVQGIIAGALLFTGTYEQLATYVVFASFVFYGMSCAAVIRLRRTRPDLPRPYRAWGYPVTPLVFIGFAACLVGNTIVEAPRDAAIGADHPGGVPDIGTGRDGGAGRGRVPRLTCSPLPPPCSSQRISQISAVPEDRDRHAVALRVEPDVRRGRHAGEVAHQRRRRVERVQARVGPRGDQEPAVGEPLDAVESTRTRRDGAGLGVAR
jgi:hypothetical protein